MVTHTLAGYPPRLAPRMSWAVPLVPATIAGFCLSGLLYYHFRWQGAGDASGLFQGAVAGLYALLGFLPSVLLAILVLVWSTIWYATGRVERPIRRLVRLLALSLSISILVSLQPDVAHSGDGGGIVGNFLAVRLESVLGYVFSTLLAAGAALCALLLSTDFMFYRYLETMAMPGAVRGEEVGVEAEAVSEMQSLQLERDTAALDRQAVDELANAIDVDAEQWTPSWIRASATEADEGVVLADADESDGAEAMVAAPRYRSWRERAGSRPLAEDPVATPEPLQPQEPEVASADPLASESALPDDGDELAVEPDVAADQEATEIENEEEEGGEELEYEEEEDVEEDEEGEELEYEEEEDDEAGEDDEEGEELEYEEADLEEEDDGEEELEYEEEDGDEELGYDDDAEYEEADEAGSDEALEVLEGLEPAVQIARPEAVEGRQGRLFAGPAADDELVAAAAKVVVETQRANVMLLQRRLRVGYDEALEVLDALRSRGIVGGAMGDPHGDISEDRPVGLSGNS